MAEGNEEQDIQLSTPTGQPEPEATPAPEPDPQPDPEPDPTPDGASEPAAEPKPDPAPGTTAGDNGFDKIRQQVQQEVGNKVRPLEQMLAAVLSRLDGQKATTKEPQAPAADPLASLTADDLLDPQKTLGVIQGLVKTVADTRKAMDEYRQQDEERTQRLAQSTQALQADREREVFARTNPEIADQYDALIETAKTRLADYSDYSDDAYRVAADFIWQSVLSEAKSKAKPAAPAAPTPPKPSTKPDKDARAAQVTRTGTVKPPQKESEPTLEELLSGLTAKQ